jgi:hypothetical protein
MNPRDRAREGSYIDKGEKRRKWIKRYNQTDIAQSDR